MPKVTEPASGEYCRGFVDKHGQWNNGFYCPKWGGPDRQYCCGPDDHKYCCPKEETQEKLHDNQAQQISLLIGLAIGSLVLLVATIVLSCYFCRCCWAYKRRKRFQTSPQLPAYPGLSRDSSDPVNYAMCPHGTLFPEFMIPVPPYPTDAPPPYQAEEPAMPLVQKYSLPPPGVHNEDVPALRQETNIDAHHRSVHGTPNRTQSQQDESQTCDCMNRQPSASVSESSQINAHEVQPRPTDSVRTNDSLPNDMPSTSSSHRSQYQIPKFKSSHNHHSGSHHHHQNPHQRASNRYGSYDSRSLSSTDSDSYTG